jgi:carboxyl-terminal processing protease
MLSNTESTINTKNKTERRSLGYVLAFFFALGAFFSGIQIGHCVYGGEQPASIFGIFLDKPVVETTRPELNEFWQVWDLLDEKFASGTTTKPVSNEERIRGAIEGLVDSFDDPYTVYFKPEDAEVFDETIAGNFSGVGMEVGLREGLITIIAPLPGTPAEKSGIIAGDVIVHIDEVSTEGMRIDEAVSLIRGEKGTVVNLEIYRDGEREFKNISITRDTIDIPTVKFEQKDKTFIIALYSFNAVAESQFKDGLKKYLESNADTLIVDLRGNPGGYLESAVAIAGYFLPAGKIVVREEFAEDSQNEAFRSRGNQVKDFNPNNLVVLVDGGSASASEILAGALKDHNIATVIGSQTFGKGSVQELVKLDDGSSLKVTVARWLTPNGVSISKEGLAPNIVIGRSAEQRLAGEDSQMDAALRFLKGDDVVSETYTEKIVNNTGEAE